MRECVWDDLAQLARHLALPDARISGRHHMLGVLPTWARTFYMAVTKVLPSARDAAWARRQAGHRSSRATNNPGPFASIAGRSGR